MPTRSARLQLWYASTSPFARKVQVTAHELGLLDELEQVEVDPWTDTRLRAINPLAKVPVLLTAQGEAVWESPIICEYLDSLRGFQLHPMPYEARWRANRLQALADGAMTAAGRLYADGRRSPDERSPYMMDRYGEVLKATLDHLEATTLSIGLTNIGEIACAALLGYLKFRWPDRDWCDRRPKLGSWSIDVAAKPSLQATPHRISNDNDGTMMCL